MPDLLLLDRYADEVNGSVIDADIDHRVRLFAHHLIHKSVIGKYTYVSAHATISYTEIGNFCSIGPNFVCGWGIHPLNGISTSPMFYSTVKQNGYTLVKENKLEERKTIRIGHDVFIGMNVTVLDGVTIGDGAVVGAGTVVSKDVAPYTIVAGNPMQVIRKRFDDTTIARMRELQWWNWEDDRLPEIEQYFFKPEEFLDRNLAPKER